LVGRPSVAHGPLDYRLVPYFIIVSLLPVNRPRKWKAFVSVLCGFLTKQSLAVAGA
jgi:hypothetical protein